MVVANPLPVPPRKTYPTGFVSVADYHRMYEEGLIEEGEKVELIENRLVEIDEVRTFDHESAIRNLLHFLTKLVDDAHRLQCQSSITLLDGEPEPDFAIVLDLPYKKQRRHPYPEDCKLVVEVAKTSLDKDRRPKKRSYARARIPVYWIVNCDDLVIEVHSDPSGPSPSPEYGSITHFRPGTRIPVVIDGTTVGEIAVDDIFK